MSVNFHRKLKSGIKPISLLALFSILSVSSLFAQEAKEAKTDIAFLKKNASDLAKSMKKEKQRALDIAKQKGWPTFHISPKGRVINLVGVDGFGLPIYEGTENETAAGTTRANTLYTGGGLGLSLSGSTIPTNSVAVWEVGGVILTSHQEFAGGRVQVKDASTTTTSHATHVGGTIAASGVYSEARGMAYGLPNLLSFDSNNANSEMSSYAPNLLLSNHSYGVIAGWNYNDDNSRWEFYGRWGDNEDYKFGYYDSTSQTWDNICYNAPYYLPVKSAGNYRNDNGPAVGQPYYRYNASGVMASAGNRPAGISSNDGYGIIGTYGTAKNILTVGAVNGLKYGSSSPSDVVMSAFTAWGPTDDGRIKPDLVADGVNLISSTNTGNANYATSSGTSMSAPNATGTLVLLQELYKQQYGVFMRSATLKGLAIATTSEAGSSPGPDYQYGWGLLNAEKAAKAILDNTTKSLISERILTQGQTETINVVASGNGPLVATICWTDPAATPVAVANALNNTTLRLVNDLDIRVSDADGTYYPWVLDPANPAAAATIGDNFRDNVEQIYIANAVPGKSYTITINHKNNLQNGSQAFSLIVTGIGGNAYCVSAPTSSADSKITNFQLSNINNTPSITCTTYSDYTSQTVQLERGESYTINLSTGTCGTVQNKIAKVFIDWNSDGDFDDSGELVATSNVISDNGTFTQSITVPSGVVPGNYSRLRVVLVETSLPNEIAACGTYAKGETQDYRVQFSEATINTGIGEIVNPVDGEMAGITKKITLKIKNYGANAISNIPVNVLIKEGAATIANINEVYYGSISASGEATFLLQSTFSAQQGKTYTIEAKTNLSTDGVADDDLATKTIAISNPTSINDTKAYFTDVAGTYYLTSDQNNGTLFWYGASGSTSSFGTGNTVITTTAPANGSTYYVGLNNYLGNMGPATKSVYGTGTYGQASYRLYFTANVPLKIESARLYIGYPGAVTFNVYDANTGIKVSTSTISVTNTRSPADPSTSATNVTSDVGRVYQLDIVFPYAGSFYLTADYNNGATLFRNNGAAGAAVYPFTESTGLFSLVSHTGSSTSMNSYWYFFYNLKVKPVGEEIATKQAVPLANLTINREDNTLISPIAMGNQWYLNGNPIDGATASTYQLTGTGTYTVKVTLSGGITITSQPYEVSTLPIVLKNFTANKQADGVLLKWLTLSETNNAKFLVERSFNGSVFETIGEVVANALQQYTYLDKSPATGINYYKIKQIDYDGKSQTFGPLVINFDILSVNNIQIYANPVKTNFTVKVAALRPQAVYHINIIDALGKKVKHLKLNGKALLDGQVIEVSELAKGTYILEIADTNVGIGHTKFIKI